MKPRIYKSRETQRWILRYFVQDSSFEGILMRTQQIPLTQAQFDSACTKLLSYGVKIEGLSGTIEHEGCKIEYRYLKDKAMLSITVVDKPTIATVGYVFKQLYKWLGVEQD